MNSLKGDYIQPVNAVLLLILCFSSISCQRSVDVPEKIPLIISVTNAPEAEAYATEFRKNRSVSGEGRPSFALPLNTNWASGKIHFYDHNTNVFLWLIQTYSGDSWRNGQSLYLLSEKTDSVKEIFSFQNRIVENGSIVRLGDGELYALVEIGNRKHPHGEMNKLMTLDLAHEKVKTAETGQSMQVSPDHSKLLFFKSNRDGYHCLLLWDFATGRVAPIISMWESAPGSGPSWQIYWSSDSKALNIKGTYGGSMIDGKAQSSDCDYIFLVESERMFSL